MAGTSFTPFFSALYNQERLNNNNTENLCTKQGNVGRKSEAYNQERVIMASEWYDIYFVHTRPSTYIPCCNRFLRIVQTYM